METFRNLTDQRIMSFIVDIINLIIFDHKQNHSSLRQLQICMNKGRTKTIKTTINVRESLNFLRNPWQRLLRLSITNHLDNVHNR